MATIVKKDELRDQAWKQDQGPLTTERHCRVTDGSRVGYRCIRWSRGRPELYGPVFTDCDETEIIE